MFSCIYVVFKFIANCFTSVIFRCELEETEEALEFCQRLTKMLGALIFVGVDKEARIKPGSIVDMFQLPGFRVNLPKAKGKPLT